MSDTPHLQTPNGTLYSYFKDTRFAPDQGRVVSRVVQLFPGQGCGIWLDRKSDCCVFCRLPAGTRLAVLGDQHEDHFENWSVPVSDYKSMIDTSLAQAQDVDSILCFNGGSFLTDREIPAKARQHLYRRFAAHPTATELLVEARPEMVTDAMLDEAQDIIGGKALKVAIGLESIDDAIRNKTLKKFIGRQSFMRAIERLHARGLKSFVYVFLGAPGLTEAESYQDAYTSIKSLAELGVQEIALSCAFVPPGGQLETLFRAGQFRPPWLWTILRLITDAKQHNWPLSVGGFDDFPPPLAIASNCDRCDAAVLAAIDQVRATGRLGCVPDCTCKAGWDQEMASLPSSATAGG